MSRQPQYWYDPRGRLNCAHGVLLYGTSCVSCERGDFPPPGQERTPDGYQVHIDNHSEPTTTPYRARCLIARILRDLEALRLPPADVARQARRLRGYIEIATGQPLPTVIVDDEESRA